MKINPSIFREYDIRGIAEKDLKNDAVEVIGKAFGTYIKGEVIIARDNRLSSNRIKNSLIKGILSTGCNVVDIGEVPVSVYYYALKKFKKAGIMITASHNPPEYNGFKLNSKKGNIYGNKIQEIRKIAEKEKFIVKKVGKLTKKEVAKSYKTFIINHFKSLTSKKKLKIVIDCGNGTPSLVYPKVLEKFAKSTKIYCKSDGRFPNHFPNPTISKNLKDLIKNVEKKKADLGIAFDGDGDRLGVVDDKGNILQGDIILLLFAREVLRKKSRQKIILDVNCSQALIEDIKNHGGIPVMSRVGHSFIQARMLKEKILLGGEMSGHFCFKENNYLDDALFASLKLIELITREKKKLSQILTDIPKYYSSPINLIKCGDKKKFEVVKKIITHFKKKHKVTTLDGARILFEDGWGLVRASNTQPALVLRFEGKTKEALKRIKREIRKEVKKLI